VNPAAADAGRFSRGGQAAQKSWPGGGPGFRVVSRRGLLGIEGFAVRARFDPNRRTQRSALTAVHRRGRQLLLEVLNPLEPGVCFSHASGGGVAFHRDSLPVHGCPVLFNRALRHPRLHVFSDPARSMISTRSRTCAAPASPPCASVLKRTDTRQRLLHAGCVGSGIASAVWRRREMNSHLKEGSPCCTPSPSFS
jgi:hypothetical protein